VGVCDELVIGLELLDLDILFIGLVELDLLTE
jgi:hypothetical protein